MMGSGNDTFGEVFRQFLLYGKWCGVSGCNKAYAVAYAEDMGVNGHGISSPNDGLHHIGRLASYTGEFHQIVQIVRYFAVEVLYQHLGHSYQVLGLVVRIRNATHVFKDDFGGSGGQCFGSWVIVEKGGSHHIHPLVGALGGEYDGYQ